MFVVIKHYVKQCSIPCIKRGSMTDTLIAEKNGDKKIQKEVASILRPMALAGLIGIMVTAGGCAPLSVDYDSRVYLPENYTFYTDGGTSELQIAEWWRNFNDPVLDKLIAEALVSNRDLIAATERYNSAMHEAGLAEADKGPAAGAGAGGFVNGSKMYVSDPRIKPDSRSKRAAGLGLEASWEPDFFGKKQSDADAAKFRALAVQDRINAVRTSITASLGRYYFEILSLKDKEKNLRKNIANMQDTLRYVKGRYEAGQAQAFDVMDVENRITSLKARLPEFEAQINARIRVIAVLCGRVPEDFVIAGIPDGLPENIPNPPQGTHPGELLLMRPDILSKRNEINARAAAVASAKADLYPRFSISFLLSDGYIKLDSTVDHASGWMSFLSGSVSVPVFTNGRIRENIAAKNAELGVALAEYEKLIIEALKEVEDSYEMTAVLNRTQQELSKGRKEAEAMVGASRKLFEHGQKNYDAVTLSVDRMISFDDSLTDVRLNRLLNLISLYRALGGGWDYHKNTAVETGNAGKLQENGNHDNT